MFYEDVKEGMEIGPVIRETSPRHQATWACANVDFDPIHYDIEYAKSRALPGVIVNGRFKFCFIIQMLEHWMGEEGALKKVGCEHRGMDMVGEPITCKGQVMRTYIEGDEHLVECEIWTETPAGKKTAPGSAVVRLPSRAK